MMEHIYSPWRSNYFKEKVEGCVFCSIYKSDEDEKHHVFYKDDICFAVMNRYPYTPGHFMIIPKNHIDNLNDMDESSWLHINKLSKIGYKTLMEFGAKGVNIGLNIGQDAGAGIPDHLHMHLVPRWIGDTNFITSIANTRIYGVDFEEIYQKIKYLFTKNLT